MPERVWDGVTRCATLSGWAADARHKLADCAKRYDWTGVFAVLDDHPGMVNASRPDGRSWYAPLHQAAHGGATTDVVERLVQLGSWRLLPAADGQTPVEIARRRGHSHLLDPLTPCPVIDIPDQELTQIQRRFHEVIRGRVADLVDEHHLRLPELAVLTESEPSAVWFAVPGMYGGFNFQLARDREGWCLKSQSWIRVVGGSGQEHTITAQDARLTAEGFV
ncbi:ankyrin repeat domain-containing protein [Micromonospora sp. CPCC 205371]|nr:ankyrin repeat domain-containing protein [Micromonospora sp. CPCC 205371]